MPAAGVCSSLGFSGTCYCAPGRSGACCETIQFGALLAPVGLDFGGVTVGATAPAQASFIFANPATIPLTLANIALSGANSADFAVVGGSCAPGSQVAAGGSCSIMTAFTPAASGQRNALLTVTTGAANYPSASVFDTQVNVPLSTVVESNAVPFTSICNMPVIFYISVDNGELLINQNGAWTTLDTSHSYAANSLDPYMVRVRQTSSSSYNTSVTTRINAFPQNGTADHVNQFFKTTTIADPSQSPSATLSGIGTIAAGSIAIDPAAPATLYSAMDGAGIYKSTDSGATWNPAATQPANKRVKAVVIKPGDGTILYAATYGGGVYRSTNSGLNWSACANGGLTNLNLVSLTIDAAGKLYAGTEAGVFVSSDSCATWAERNTGLPN